MDGTSGRRRRGARAAALASRLATVLVVLLAAAATTPARPVLARPAWALGCLCMGAAALWYGREVRHAPTRGRRAWLAAGLVAPALLACAFLPVPREVSARIPGDGVTLAASLYLPRGAAEGEPGAAPGVVLVHGSTRQTRDGLLGLYRSVAAGLARRGVAALVYDKRGCGDSTGDFDSALFAELASDANAALGWLAARQEVDPRRVGLWGISQGGWVSIRAASGAGAARFLVLVSAPMAPEGEQRLHEWTQRLREEGVPAEHRREAVRLQRAIWEYYGTGEGWEEVSAAWERARGAPWWSVVEGLERGGPAPPAEVRSPAGWASLRWHRTDRVFDPREALRELPLPVLAVYGGRDSVLPMPETRLRAEALADERGALPTRVLVYDDARHPLLELAPWPRFPSGYLDSLATWIRAVDGTPAGREASGAPR